jgi:tryptophanyl-tRNA synthetase
LELTRDLAVRVNHLFGQEDAPILKLPDPLIRPEGARVMSLTDGTRKMSKSDPSEMSRIHLLDSPEDIQKKIKRCKTDAIKGLSFDGTDPDAPSRPECHNLLSLYQLLSGRDRASVAQECADMGWGQFKPLLTEVLIENLKPIQTQYRSLRADPGYLQGVLRSGREKAGTIAQETLDRVKTAMGFTLPQ